VAGIGSAPSSDQHTEQQSDAAGHREGRQRPIADLAACLGSQVLEGVSAAFDERLSAVLEALLQALAGVGIDVERRAAGSDFVRCHVWLLASRVELVNWVIPGAMPLVSRVLGQLAVA
jgi:hypothetical protein